MLEPPSPALLERLLGRKLCRPADLRRARSRVRRLARDLPAFDSVWIDALVHDRRLTRFQAEVLESDDPDFLFVGPCVLLDELGRSRRAETYLARHREAGERCVLKLLRVAPEATDAVADGVRQLVNRMAGFGHPSVVGPHAAVTTADGLVTISRHVPGPHLGELLVRRGRFAPTVVLEIARQLLDGLAALAARGVVHGDIRLANVRLTAGGVAVLVDAGIIPAAAPELTIHAAFSPECYDGIAPELIGTGNPPTVSSDLYALGCLLWCLLAGRPPFPTGDPLAKLAAHQTRSIEDIRTWAPDTPPRLATLLQALTARAPHERPAGFTEALEQWGRPRRTGRQRLRRFRHLFESGIAVPPSRQVSSIRWAVAVAVLVALAGTMFALFDQGARGQLLSIAARLPGGSGAWADKQTELRQSATELSKAETVQPLPPPNAEGVITLTSRGPYDVAQIVLPGGVVIRGVADGPSEIVVGDAPLKISAEQVRLENVRLRQIPPAGGRAPRSLLLVQTQMLTLSQCTLETILHPEEASACLTWKPLDRRDPTGGVLRISDTAFFGDGPALVCLDAPRRMDVTNGLKVGDGAFLTLMTPLGLGELVQLQCQRLTLRDSGALLRFRVGEPSSISPGAIRVGVADCAFTLRESSALFELVAERLPPRWGGILELDGENCLAAPGVQPVAWIDSINDRRTALNAAELELDGITVGKIGFAGAAGTDPADSVVERFEAPRRGTEAPGFRVPDSPPQETQEANTAISS